MVIHRTIRGLRGVIQDQRTAALIAHVVALRTLALGVNIATGLFTAAMLGPAGRGELAALTTMPGFLAGLGSFGLHAALIYNMRAEPELERNYLGNALVLTFITGILVVIVGWVAEPYVLAQYSSSTILVGRLLLISTPFTVMTWAMIAASEVRGWFTFANRILSIQSFVTLIFLLGQALMHALTPKNAAFAYIFPTFPVFFYFGYRICRHVRPIFGLRRYFLVRLLNFGLRFCGVDILNTMSSFIDQILVVVFLPPAAVGAYSVALSTARLLTVLESSVVAVLFPRVAARDDAEIIEQVAAVFRVITVLSVTAAAALAVFGPWLLLLLYGAKFAAAIAPFRLLLVAMVLITGIGILYQAYTGSGRPGLVTFIEACGTGALVLLMFLLVSHFGIVGAASAVLIAAALRLATVIAGIRLVFRMDPRLLLPGRGELVKARTVFQQFRTAGRAGESLRFDPRE